MALVSSPTTAPRRARVTRALVCAALLLLIAAGAPAAADAATVSVSAGTLSYTAGPGETNDVRLATGTGTIAVTDPGATVAAGGGCSSGAGGAVTCSTAGVTRVRIETGDGNDR